MKPREMKEMPLEELRRLLLENRQELFNLRFQRVSHQLDNVMRLRQVRREVARLLTVISEREKRG